MPPCFYVSIDTPDVKSTPRSRESRRTGLVCRYFITTSRARSGLSLFSEAHLFPRKNTLFGCLSWRRGRESNSRIKVLQTSALPLGYHALYLSLFTRRIVTNSLLNVKTPPQAPCPKGSHCLVAYFLLAAASFFHWVSPVPHSTTSRGIERLIPYWRMLRPLFIQMSTRYQ